MLSRVCLFADRGAPLSMGFSRQEHWRDSLLQAIFPTQASNPVLLHCRQNPYCLTSSKVKTFYACGIRPLLGIACNELKRTAYLGCFQRPAVEAEVCISINCKSKFTDTEKRITVTMSLWKLVSPIPLSSGFPESSY